MNTTLEPETDSVAATRATSARSNVPPKNLVTSANQQRLLEGSCRFDAWLEKTGGVSYDPYDVWGTSYGLFARRVYYEKGKLGLPLVAPVLLMEIVCPGLRGLFVKKDRFATADAQLLLAFLNLYHQTNEQKFLQKAERLAEELLSYSISGYSGHCWGYPFDWQNNRGLWKKNTPYITCTPYCFEAFLALYDTTGKTDYLEIAKSVAKFVYADLKDTPAGKDAAAGSYSPMDETKVVNASAYRAYVLFETARRFDLTEYRAKAQRNLNFILQAQRADGAWLYATEGSGEQFIDHFHTCFVLKNLWKLNENLQSEAVAAAIRKGYAYYRRELFNDKNLPKSFSVEPRLQLAKLEMYNFAEAITLGALLRDEIPEAFDLACELADHLVTEYQLPAGYFVTRVYLGGWKHTTPFLRWPQAQLFYALTNLLVARSAEHRSASIESDAADQVIPEVPDKTRNQKSETRTAKQSRFALWGLFKRKEKWTLSWRGRFVVAAAMLLLCVLFVMRIEPFLAVTQPVQSKYLVIEGWVPNYALEESIAEFKSKPYEKIFTVGADPLSGVNIEEGDSIAFVALARLKWLGISPDLIQAVPAHIKFRNRTFQSAVALRKWIEEHHLPVTSFNVVTVGPHARRSRLLFEKAFEGKANIGIIAIEDREYDPKRWWKYSEGVREVMSETLGYIYARFFFHPET